jgi:hypothetical protein
MNGIVTIEQPGLCRFLQNSTSEKPLLVPFENRILLTTCTICGFSLVDGYDDTASGLSAGDRLGVKMDPDNVFDDRAIAVLTPSGKLLGWLPCSVNSIITNLLKAGKLIYGEVKASGKMGASGKVVADIYLEE